MIVLMACQAVLLSVAMALAWWYQKREHNAGWSDVFWTFATGGAALMGAAWPLPEVAGHLSEAAGHSSRPLIVVALITLWTARLGLYLRGRTLIRPEDARYAGFRREWGADFQRRLFWFLQIQAAAGLPLAVAMMLAARNPAPGVSSADLLALLISVAAILGTALADRQLARFAADPANKKRVCDRGLWAWSRHPNYFFEWLGWFAWPLFAFNAHWPLGWLAFLAPVLMYWLLVHVSGIPPLERAMLASRGEAWRAYQNRTSAFFPLPPRHAAKA